MSRGFNFFNYMTYHMVRDYFKAKDQCCFAKKMKRL